MQSNEQNTFGKDANSSNGGGATISRSHQRHQSLGKAMPVTSLLLNFPPLHRSAYYTRDERLPDHDMPPIFFPISDFLNEQQKPTPTSASSSSSASASPTTTPTSTPSPTTTSTPSPTTSISMSTLPSLKGKSEVTEIEKNLEIDRSTKNASRLLLDDSDNATNDTINEHDFEIIVSDCGDSNDDNRNGDDDDDDGITLIGNSKFYTPCLTCTNNAPEDLATRPSAINEMCRRLCSDECRLRLSLAGFEPPSEAAIKSRAALTEYFQKNVKNFQNSNVDEVDHVKLQPPALPLTRPPPPIAIERKKFLMDLITTTDSDNDSNFVDESNEQERSNDDEQKMKPRNSQLLNVVSSDDGKNNRSNDTNTDTDADTDDDGRDVNKGRDPHEIALLKALRERFEIAEALEKTSAMTSTAQIKQRLAARKLEIELESLFNDKFANDSKPNSNSNSKLKSCNASSIASTTGNNFADGSATMPAMTVPPMGCDITAITTTTTTTTTKTTTPIIVTNARNAQSSMPIKAKSARYDYEPPRDLLLYLVRMGSFNSAPKINNVDSQDDGLQIPQGLNTRELLHHVKLLRGEQYPPLLSRFFIKPLELSAPSLATQLSGSDITDGLRYLQLNTVSRVCSAPLSASPNHIRLLQWNILSQTLGQNNDGFVLCPEEALTWENRKFLIIQEILQHNPDIVCLQEVDHFKFLQTILGSQNYEGIFFPKPDSPCLYIEDNNGPDGCAIFFKRDKFELKKYETRILEVWRVQSNQVAIAANLYIKSIDKEICVCTTHLKARQGSLLSKLRNEQGRDLLRFVRNFSGENRPVLLCGDFNAKPIEPVYATILSYEKMKLSSAYADIRSQDISNDRKDINKHDNLKNNSDTEKENISEDFIQESVQNEPPYTTWKIREDGEECHTIDYVFYAKDQLKVLNCLEFPPEDDIGKNRTPSFQYPSDHFSLVCDFEVLENQENQNPKRKDEESKFKAQ